MILPLLAYSYDVLVSFYYNPEGDRNTSGHLAQIKTKTAPNATATLVWMVQITRLNAHSVPRGRQRRALSNNKETPYREGTIEPL